MSYHYRRLASLGDQTPRSDAARALSAIEGRLGVTLPRSLREWYSLEDPIGPLSRQDTMRPLEGLALVPGCDSLLLVADENQGVCQWAVDLGSGPDPRVVVNVEERGWAGYTSRFSDLVFAFAWDWLPADSGACAQTPPLTASDLACLVSHFTPLITTFSWPGAVNYRFQAANARLLLWSAADQCDWNLGADSGPALAALLRVVWDLSDLATSLYDLDPTAKACLAGLRGHGA